MNEQKDWSKNSWVAAFLLVIPGCIIIGLGIGLALGQPGFGAIIGLGAGLLSWGLIIVTRSRN